MSKSKVELKYTFNSFKYMEDFNISDLESIEERPFKLVSIMETLLLGAMNHDPKVKVGVEEVQAYLEEYAVENSLTTLLEDLMSLLEVSSFFKSLQKK